MTNLQAFKSHNYVKKFKGTKSWQTNDHTSIFETDGIQQKMFKLVQKKSLKVRFIVLELVVGSGKQDIGDH